MWYKRAFTILEFGILLNLVLLVKFYFGSIFLSKLAFGLALVERKKILAQNESSVLLTEEFQARLAFGCSLKVYFVSLLDTHTHTHIHNSILPLSPLCCLRETSKHRK
jgi:hypothetical protein